MQEGIQNTSYFVAEKSVIEHRIEKKEKPQPAIPQKNEIKVYAIQIWFIMYFLSY